MINSRALKGFFLAFLLVLAGGLITVAVGNVTVSTLASRQFSIGPFWFLVGVALMAFGLLVGVISLFL